jgi:hypothetical protein
MRFAILILVFTLNACATVVAPQAAPETVGALVPSYHSIAVAAVHPGTDLSTSMQAVDTDDAPVSVSGEAVEAPDVAPKGGLVLGAVR